MATTSYKELGAKPISESSPAGEDSRYEAEYAQVLEEIEKLSFSGQGTPISWPTVAKNAEIILSQKSKDLQIASYLAVALFHNNGLQGVLDGIDVLTAYFEKYWENGWPALKRIRGRINAIDWWHERCVTFLQDFTDPIPAQTQSNLAESIKTLDNIIAEKMPDASSLRDLSNAVQRLVLIQEKKEEPTPKEEVKQDKSPQEATKAPATQVAASPVTPPVQPVAPSTDDPAQLRKAFVLTTTAYLSVARREEPANASIWQLSRLMIWGPIQNVPSSENGQTMIPAPDLPQITQAQRKLESGNALEAAISAEEIFLTSPFNLDLQALIFNALSSLGAPFANAATTVKEETIRFFARMPGVDKLSYIDGTPFASPATIAWLKSVSQENTTLGTSGSHAGGALDDVFASAKELALNSKLNEALLALDEAKTESAATNLSIRSYQTRLLLDANRVEPAQALAEVLLEEVKAHNLDTWDPHLAHQALSCVYDALTRSPENYVEALKETKKRLARVKPSAL